ncbi:MAG TPA: multiheme c-type cytochrome [Gammaproteobacteria bacterium]|nr:multiheme c-type cytochrome [Gammaproteobacteria bacterium]
MALHTRSSMQMAILVFSALIAGTSGAQQLPEDDGDIHNGVASCAGSTCHGAVRQFTDSNILHNEFITWTREDRHAKAYQVLLNKESKLIAQKLGIGPPHTEALCLDCHADNVPEKRRGKKFQLSDGVGCESCHGGSENWLTSHVKDNHQQNVKNGLYPTEQPAARAGLCLSCHYGNDDKFVTHRIMGAGHPRISFELDNFTELMPPHHQADADYKQRKGLADPMQTWATGQLVFVRRILDQLEHRGLREEGLFPELSLFDCHSCHHPMSRMRWTARSGIGLGPGAVRLQDANFIMLQALFGGDKERAEQLRRLTRNLHQSTSQGIGAMRDAIGDYRKILPELEKTLQNRSYSDAEIKAVLGQLIQSGMNNEFADYAAAEQAVMAIASLLSALDARAALSPKTQQAVNARLDELYTCTDDDEKYRASCFTDGLKQLRSNLGG